MAKGEFHNKLTVREFFRRFPDDAACLDHIMSVRYGHRHTCTMCGVVGATFHKLENRARAYACAHCGGHLFPTAGTIFEKSRTPLQLWFYAIYLFSVSRNGVAGMELVRALGVTKKTGWRMADQIRKLMDKADKSEATMLKGVVESDEAFVGGVLKGSGKGNYRDNKVIILGLKERSGRIVTRIIPDTKGETIRAVFNEVVSPNATIHTDEAKYYGLVARDGWDHRVVNHGAKEYARPDHLRGGEETIHVNGVENFWGHFKKAVAGTHIHISKKHAPKYVGEFTYRANHREMGNAMFDALIAAL